ncbi:MSCRAMM family protein [Marinicella litoralis]|uniref:Carboxypeptidase family protein n=1 Tax=Marinicella litoralis TaxID=644220 RepID=A0A4R6XQZ7_9GAMM|nr:carboxypeptidase-like regulatory domain-containing protein [Marinicella litoralis]TDR20660.1 carboxypeptidase family protein [Marinicella litoralis]
MKYKQIWLLLLIFSTGYAQQRTNDTLELETWKDLLAENRITQLEYNQQEARVKYQQRQKEMLVQNQNNTAVINGGGTASISGTVNAVDPENILISLCTGNVYNCVGTTTDQFGAYTFTNLAVNSYLVVANDNYDDYLNAIWAITGTEPCFNNCPTDADNQIVLADGEARVGVDLDLTVGASISGTVLSGATPVEGNYVSLRNTPGQQYLGNAYTDASGNYSFKGIPDDDYYLLLQSPDDIYIDAMWSSTGTVQCYDCNPDVDSTISLAPAEIRSGVDFNLTIGATLTGQLTDQDTLAGVETLSVQLYDTAELPSYWYFYTQFDGSGNYTVSGIPTGSYKAYLEPQYDSGNVYIPEVYNNIQCNACTTLVYNGAGDTLNLVNGATMPNIDFALEVGASISGFIVDNNNIFLPLTQYGRIMLFNDSNRFLASEIVYGTDFDPAATGEYKVGGLIPGMYFVQGGDVGRQFYQRELFENIACPWSGCDRGGGGDPVVLGDGEQRLGVNFLLNYGGKITGTVTDALTGLPADDTYSEYVQFYDSNGAVAGGGVIEEDGSYISARALPPGDYSVRTGSMFNGVFISPYVMEKYDPAGNIDCPGVSCDLTAGNVTVTAYDPLDPTPEDSATVTGIDFALSTGFSFSGTITELGSADPIADVHVLVYNDMGQFANWATTDAAGAFTVHGLPAGTYYALTNNGSNLPFMGLNQTAAGGWIDILFNGIPCPGSACDVTTGDAIVLGAANRGTTVPVFDFTMVAGGTIAGQVRNFDSQLPASGVEVNVYNSSGDSYGSYVSDSNGYFLTVGFPEGTYYLTTANNGALLDGMYGGGYCINQNCNPLDASPIVIVGDQSVVGADFELRPDYIFRAGLE